MTYLKAGSGKPRKVRIARRLIAPIIGREIVISESRNKYDKGISGRVVDETRYTLLIKTDKGEKRVLKNNITIMIKGEKESILIKGENIIGRAFERIKKRS